jgi:rhamnose transport system ATP-binding protein
MSAPLLSLRNLRKSFGGTRALTEGHLDLHAGQVTALIGENGAGKSTLVKILTGVHQPDAGSIRLEGREVRIGSPVEARRLGISVIHQESVVFDDLSVAENIFVTAMPRRLGVIDWRAMDQAAAKLLARLGARIGPRTPMRALGIAQKHLVQIARALSHDSRIVVMDEPTSALSHQEAQELLEIVQRLKGAGCAILYISHKFEEIFAVADRYVVFRDGGIVGEGLLPQTSLDNLITLMVGRPIGQIFPKASAAIGGEILRLEQLGRKPEFAGVNLSVRQGEILGIYGLAGAGRSEVMQALFGVTRPDEGHIFLDGREVQVRTPAEAIRLKMAYVPEDRQQQGALLSLSIRDNIALPSLRQLSRCRLTNTRLSGEIALQWLERLQIRASGASQGVAELSGGNQQKVVLAKWLQTRPRVLILDEPTKGIDVGSKAAVHRLMSEWVQQGLAVIMVSSELPEILGMSDRILVMRRGRVRAEIERADATAEVLARAATAA